MKSKKEPESSESALLLRLLDADQKESPGHDVSRTSRKVSFRTAARRGRQATSVRALATKFNALSETHPSKATLTRRASREEPRRAAGNVKAAIRIFEQGAEDATPPAKRASELPHANAPGAKHYCVVSNGDDVCAEDQFPPSTERRKSKTLLQGSETYVRTVRREAKLAVAEVLEEDGEYEAIQVPSMLPNSSFLWRSCKVPAVTAPAPDDYDDVQPYESEDTLYDDVGQPESDGYEYCDIYDDVRTDAQQDLYEPIYASSNSSCDQSNSLYGVASTVYAEGHSSNGSVQQVPRSETSDEWVDLEQSDVEQIQRHNDSLNNKHPLQERARSRTTSAWSHKVRKQRQKSQREESRSSSDNGKYDYTFNKANVTSSN